MLSHEISMMAILEVTSGPLAGQKFTLREGQTLVVGRSSQANVSVPEDNRVSSLHFALEVSAAGCRLLDRASTNGTYCNKARVTEHWMKDGDEITAGRTTFVVRLAQAQSVPGHPAPQTGKDLRFGHWSFGGVLQGWDVLEGLGMRKQSSGGSFLSIAFAEEPLPDGASLASYVENQIALMNQLLKEPKVETLPGTTGSAEEGQSVLVQHLAEDGRAISQRQVYRVSEKLVGIATVTALREDYASHQGELERFVETLKFAGGQ